MTLDQKPAPIVEVPGATLPKGGAARWITASDGTRLRVLVWEVAAARGTVFLFGGRTEYAEKYFEVVGELLARGLAVATVDWRGQGLSERPLADPRKGHVGNYAEFDDDFKSFMEEIAPSMPAPHVAFAHSMGGNVLMRGLHDHADYFTAAVMTAPMLGLRLGSNFAKSATRAAAVLGASLGLAGNYIPGGTPKANNAVPFEQNILTHDRARYALHQSQIDAEPALGLGGSTYGWLAASFRSIAKVMRPDYLAAIKTPLLIVAAAQDRLIERDALTFAASHVAEGKMVLIDKASHEILIETDEVRAQFWSAFDGFIARYLRVH